MDSEISILTAVVGAVATAFGVFVAWLVGRRSEKQAEKQAQLNSTAVAMEWMRDLRSWASEVIDVLSAAAYDCEEIDCADPEMPGEVPPVLRPYRTRLSSLVDRGRFFLPNSHTDAHGRDQPLAYRGFRHKALDPLVASIRVTEGVLGTYSSRRDALVQMKRLFVSAIQSILAPESSNRLVAEMIHRSDRSGMVDKTLGGLIPSEDDVPPGADALLRGNRDFEQHR